MTICIRKNDAEQLLSLFRESNSDVIPLHVAENILLFDRLDGIFTTDPSLALEDIKYQSSYGELDLRTEIAAFLSRSFSLEQSPLTAEQVSCFSSTRCALESAARALFYRSRGGWARRSDPNPPLARLQLDLPRPIGWTNYPGAALPR